MPEGERGVYIRNVEWFVDIRNSRGRCGSEWPHPSTSFTSHIQYRQLPSNYRKHQRWPLAWVSCRVLQRLFEDGTHTALVIQKCHRKDSGLCLPWTERR